PEPALEDGNRRSASGQDVRCPAAIDRSHLRVLTFGYGSGTVPLRLESHRKGPGFLTQLQHVSVAEQNTVVRIEKVHESSPALHRFGRQRQLQQLEGIFVVDFETDLVYVLHIGKR